MCCAQIIRIWGMTLCVKGVNLRQRNWKELEIWQIVAWRQPAQRGRSMWPRYTCKKRGALAARTRAFRQYFCEGLYYRLLWWALYDLQCQMLSTSRSPSPLYGEVEGGARFFETCYQFVSSHVNTEVEIDCFRSFCSCCWCAQRYWSLP